MKQKKVAIIQSNYIPWKGYFDIIAYVDEFIIYDDMQYTKRDWRNRNIIKTQNGTKWLTIPISAKGKYTQKIKDTKINGSKWAVTHWKSLEANYAYAPYFKEIKTWLEPLYLENSLDNISIVNHTFIIAICKYLEINTTISNSWDYDVSGRKSERLANLCTKAKASQYISGPSAKRYIIEKTFNEKGINMDWFNYEGYPEYSQLWGEFTHEVTILDLLFNCGKDSKKHMKYVS